MADAMKLGIQFCWFLFCVVPFGFSVSLFIMTQLSAMKEVSFVDAPKLSIEGTGALHNYHKWLKGIYTPFGYAKTGDHGGMSMRAYGLWDVAPGADYTEGLFPITMTTGDYKIATMPAKVGSLDFSIGRDFEAKDDPMLNILDEKYPEFGAMLSDYDPVASMKFNRMMRVRYKLVTTDAVPTPREEKIVEDDTGLKEINSKSFIYQVKEITSDRSVELMEIPKDGKTYIDDITVQKEGDVFVLNSALVGSNPPDDIILKKLPDSKKNYYLARYQEFDNTTSESRILKIIEAANVTDPSNVDLTTQYFKKTGGNKYYYFEKKTGYNTLVPTCDSRVSTCVSCAPMESLHTNDKFVENRQKCLLNYRIMLGMGAQTKYIDRCNDINTTGTEFLVTPMYAHALYRLAQGAGADYFANYELQNEVDPDGSNMNKTMDIDLKVGEMADMTKLTPEEQYSLYMGALEITSKNKGSKTYSACLKVDHLKDDLKKTRDCALAVWVLQSFYGHVLIISPLAFYVVYVLVYTSGLFRFIQWMCQRCYNTPNNPDTDDDMLFLTFFPATTNTNAKPESIAGTAEILRSGTYVENIICLVIIGVFYGVVVALQQGHFFSGEIAGSLVGMYVLLLVFAVTSIYLSQYTDNDTWIKNVNGILMALHVVLVIVFPIVLFSYTLGWGSASSSMCAWDVIPVTSNYEIQKYLYQTFYIMFGVAILVFTTIYSMFIILPMCKTNSYNKLRKKNPAAGTGVDEGNAAYVTVPMA